LTHSLNYYVTFIASYSTIQEHGMDRLIGKAHESRVLYYLVGEAHESYFATPTPKILHDYLGHTSLSKLKMIVPGLEQIQVLDCESCHKKTC